LPKRAWHPFTFAAFAKTSLAPFYVAKTSLAPFYVEKTPILLALSRFHDKFPDNLSANQLDLFKS
jgi:hypothetical protein